MTRRFFLKCLALSCAALLALAPATGAAGAAPEYIGVEKAKSIALADAGVSAGGASFLKAHLDDDDRRVVYDVEFISGNAEYDYEIDALNGRVLESDREIGYYSIPGKNSTTTRSGEYIGEEAAKAAALKDAGISPEEATFLKAYLEDEHRRIVYEIEFISGNAEYDYEIDALNGRVLESDREIEYYRAQGKQPAPVDTAGYIGEDRAKAIALASAGISESQAVSPRVRLDYDGGRVDYDVDFSSGDTRYEYEIDALSGEILEYDQERRKSAASPAPAAPSGSLIGEDRAKAIALADAGLSQSAVTRMRVKLDRDDGRRIYEVDFRRGRAEYEYEIDAYSGEILGAEID